MFFSFIPLLILLAIIGGVVYGIVAWRRRHETVEDLGIGTARRLYFYGVSFVALMMVANGLVQILQFVLDALFGGELLSPSRGRLALGLSLVIVGLPVWAFHWFSIGRFVRDFPVEVGSLVRKVYTYLVLAVALGLGVAAGVSVLWWIFGGRSFGGYPWAAVVMWTGVWLLHWRLESSDGQPNPESMAVRRLYLYIATLAMLTVGVLGVGRAAHIVLREGYDALVSLTVLLPSETGLWRSAMKLALAMALVGGTMWAGHWFRLARHDFKSSLRQIYLHIFAMVGGLVTILVAVGIILFGLLVWLIGVPGDERAADHFRFLPGALATLGVGVGILGYHSLVARREAQDAPDDLPQIRRFFVYIAIAIGLGTMAAGVAVLVSTAVGIVGDRGGEVLSGAEPWRNGIVLGLTMGILGLPLWAQPWASVQRRIAAGRVDERLAPPRRVFIFVALVAGVLAGLSSGSFVIFVFLRGLLDGDPSQVVGDARVAIGIVAATALFLPYYWMVYRQDRRGELQARVLEAPPRRQKAVTLLAADGATPLVRALEQALDLPVRLLRWADHGAVVPTVSEAELLDLARRVDEAAGANVLLIPEDAGFRVLSYD